MVNGIKCPYTIEAKCGLHTTCKGCKEDPNKSTMTYDEFRDEQYYWNCDDCKYCNPRADQDGIESPCKRLDHKKYSFAKAVFYSYDCGQRNGCICSDFEPNDWQLWLARHYKPEFIKEYENRIEDNDVMYICIDHNWAVRYEVNKKDFFNNNFLDANGNLKWIRKGYYKRSKKSSIGYKYVWEYPDGVIIEGANSRRKDGE